MSWGEVMRLTFLRWAASMVLVSTFKPPVTITTRTWEPRSTGRITAWWMPMPPANETASVAANAGQYDHPWFVVSVHRM